MKIKNGKFTINSDSLGNIWVTEECISDTTGKPFHKNYGYHKSVKDCMNAFVRYRSLGADARNTSEALKAINKALDEANQALNDFIEKAKAEGKND